MMIPLEEKVFIIRKLVEERERSPLARFFVPYLKDMSAQAAMASPEGTIVTIIDGYHHLRSTGDSATEALTAIERFRSTMFPGRMPRGCGLEEYIKYRVRLEHRRGRQMSDWEISRAISVTTGVIERFFPPKHGEGSGPLHRGSGEYSPIPFSPNLPDVTKSIPIKAYSTDSSYMLLLSQDVAPIGGGDFIKYKFVMTLIDKRDNQLRCVVTLENSSVASNVLCVFGADGSHSNFGSLVGPDLMHEFVTKGIGLVRKRFNLTKIEELKHSPQTKEQDHSAGGQGSAGRGRPSDYELSSRVASTIDGFIDGDGVSEFESNRLHVVIDDEYRVSISEARFVKNALVSVPLNDLMLALGAVREGGPVRHVAVDMAAMSVIARLSP